MAQIQTNLVEELQLPVFVVEAVSLGNPWVAFVANWDFHWETARRTAAPLPLPTLAPVHFETEVYSKRQRLLSLFIRLQTI